MDEQNQSVPPVQTAEPKKPTENPAPIGQKNTVWAFVAYLLFFIPLLVDGSKHDPFVKYHVRQSLGLLVVWVIVWAFTSAVPFVGWTFGPLLSLALFILWIIGVVHAFSGEQKPVPIIGEYSEKWLAGKL